jgi:hypothetical protein
MATHIASGDAPAALPPVNIVYSYVGNRPVRALIDTGAALSVLSGDIFRRIRRSDYTIKPNATHKQLLAADSSPMPVIAEIDVDVKIAGLHIPCTFSVVQNLGFQAILGMDFLTEAHAVVDLKNHTLSICDALITVPLVRGDDNFTAFSTDDIQIPAHSEAIFSATAKIKHRNGYYVAEASPYARCTKLLVARTVFNARRSIFCCRVFNPTDKAIELSANTPVAMVSPVTVYEHVNTTCQMMMM